MILFCYPDVDVIDDTVVFNDVDPDFVDTVVLGKVSEEYIVVCSELIFVLSDVIIAVVIGAVFESDSTSLSFKKITKVIYDGEN